MKALLINQSITARTAMLDRYLNDISKIRLLTADDEAELSKKILMGDKVALDKLVSANLRFVISVAKKYQHLGMGIEDLISEGNIGLIKAAERFDATKGFKFISFAVWWIRQGIRHAISEKQRVVRLPGNQLTGMISLRKAADELEQRLERFPSVEELADFMEVDDEMVISYMMGSVRTVSIDEEIGEGVCLLDVLPDMGVADTDLKVTNDFIKMELGRIMDRLTKREREILELSFGLQGREVLTIQAIAEKLKVCTDRIRQLKMGALYEVRMRSKQSLKGYY